MFYLETIIMLATSLARKDGQRLSPCPWLCVVCYPHYSLDEVGIDILLFQVHSLQVPTNIS